MIIRMPISWLSIIDVYKRQHYAPQTDVAIELGGEDAKIIYFEGGNVEQRCLLYTSRCV